MGEEQFMEVQNVTYKLTNIVAWIFDKNIWKQSLNCFFAGFAQYTIIPARYCYQLKTNLDVDRACLLERKGLYMQSTSLRFIVICVYDTRFASKR